MDLNEIWQEHKRFIVTLCSAALLFFIGTPVVASVFVPVGDGERRVAPLRFGRSLDRAAFAGQDTKDFAVGFE